MRLRVNKKAKGKTSIDLGLVEDDRTFEVECVRSALEFNNRAWGGQEPHPAFIDFEEAIGPKDAPASDFSERAADAFAWLPEILRKRAERAKIPVANIPAKIAPVNDHLTERFCDELEIVLALLQDKKPWKRGFNKTAFEVIDRALDSVAIYQRLRFIDGRPIRVSLPILRDAGNCMGYAMLVVAENRW